MTAPPVSKYGSGSETVPLLSTVLFADAIRGKRGYRKGLHIWCVGWPQACRGTHPLIGVATADSPLSEQGYKVGKIETQFVLEGVQVPIPINCWQIFFCSSLVCMIKIRHR